MSEGHLDYETRSEIALDERGTHNYATHPTTEILLAAFAEGDGKIKVWQPHLEPKMPSELRDMLEDPWFIMKAWNVTFERAISKYVKRIDKPIQEWRDVMVKARALSLPGSLDEAGKILGLKEDEAKLSEGKRLIKKFCEPAIKGGEQGLFGITKAGFRDWTTDPEDWELFVKYVEQDVRSERTIDHKLDKFDPMTDAEWVNWFTDQIINERGLPVKMELVNGAATIAKREMDRQKAIFADLTQLENPSSPDQLLPWLRDRGYTFSSLGKAFVARALNGEGNLTEDCKEALRLRTITSKSSVNKFTAFQRNVNEDARLRHQFVFMKARTGRWAGRDVQPQNLARPVKKVEKQMDLAIELVQKMDYDEIVRVFGDPIDVVVSTTRSSFQAPDGEILTVADLAAIENITLGYLARSESILNVFREGRDPYLDFAVSMYDTPYDVLYAEWKAGDSSKRTLCKPGCLGCGYRLGGGSETLDDDGNKTYSGLMGYSRNMGIIMTQEEADKAVLVFRKKYPEVKQLWYDMEHAAAKAIRNPGKVIGVSVPNTPREREKFIAKGRNPDLEAIVSFKCTGTSMLEMLLPSGRSIYYINPRAEDITVDGRNGPYTKTVLSYEGREQTGSRAWTRIDTHGGKLVENAVQAIARDILVSGMHNAEAAGFVTVGHVHDELITLDKEDSGRTEKDLEDCLTKKPWWVKGDLPLKAEGYRSKVYRK